MNKSDFSFDKIIHNPRLRALSRRGMAALLTLIMTVGLLPASSLAAGAEWPLQATVNVADPTVDPVEPDGSGEAPTITVEVNGVIDESNKLTGFVEVAIRVKPAQLHLAADGTIVTSTLDPNYDHSETQPFSSLAVALEYSDKLTPWEWEKLDGNWDKLDVSIAGNETQAIDATAAIGGGFSTRKMVEIDPLHKKTRIAQAAISPKGTTTGGGAATAAEGDGDEGTTTPVTPTPGPTTPTTPTATGGGYLYLMAEGFKAKEYNDEDTVLAVVRFKYERDKDDETKNPWSTMFPQGASNPAVTDWIDPASPNCLVKLADAATVRDPIDPIVDWEVRYESGKSAARPKGNLFYYSTDTTDGVEAYDPSKPTTDAAYMSQTSNCMELAAVDTTAATLSTTTVVPGKINFTLVNRLSYNFSGGDPNDFATVLFYDWDDTLIGTLVVKKDVDSRKRVNDFVLKNFIYTDGNDVAAGDDTNLSLQDNTEATISSLERKDNYRGKYDWTAPGPDVTTPVVANGNDFPLSNKLDYVFFKRPMVNNEAKKPDPDGYAGGATDPQYLEDLELWKVTEYIQKSNEAGEGEWDTEYPYTHGWALVEDYRHPENVWTTLGAGELMSYTDYRTTPGTAGVAQTTPAEISVSDGGTLAFADFDFSEHSAGNVYAVKAIYEQGEELLPSTSPYRLIKAPYFNKLNAKAATSINASTGLPASSGGSYSVELTYERSNVTDPQNPSDTIVHGVTRIRSISVRQDTTEDVKWITEAALGVDHNLTLTDLQEAYVGKGKTTYTLIPVSNVDEITFTLALSARQNTVDYYIKDEFNSNFVVGTDRIGNDNDADRVNKNWNVPDNYNYLTADSNTTDAYYDAKYLEREGSHGFVLYGTLNNIMEQATLFHHGGTEFYTYITNDTMADANLRHPTTKEPATSNNFTEQTDMEEAIKAAALQAEAHVGQADEADYWNAEHGHAQLTYHQLQWFITDYITTGSATLMSPSAAQAQQIEWCHLDAVCAAASSGKPTTWEELMQVADAGDDAKIKLLSAGEIESYFALRDVGGAVWNGTAGVATFATNVINAVAAIKGLGVAVSDITWDQVQYYLDQGAVGASAAAMDQYGSENYWWYDKATDGTIDSWSDLDLAVKAAIAPSITLPDGRTVSNRPAKLNQLESTFNTNAGDPNATQAWIDATHNLCADGVGTSAGVGTKFADWTTFVNEVKDAWTAAGGMAVTNPTWEQVQYHVIHKNDGGYAFPATDPAESSKYWWKDGGQKIVDLPSLLAAADKANNGSTAILDSLTFSFLEDDLFFRGSKKGEKFATVAPWSGMSADDMLTDLKSKICALVAAEGTNLTWNQVQYYLIYGTAPLPPATSDIDPEAAYYWWKTDGVTGTTITFSAFNPSSPAAVSATMKSLVEAVFRAEEYGDPNAMDAFNTASDIFDLTHLVQSTTASPTTMADLTQYSSKAAFSAAMKAIIDAGKASAGITNSFTMPTLTWYQVQDYYLEGGGSLRTDAAVKADTNVNYWWYDKTSAVQDPAQPISDAIAVYLASGKTTTDINALKNTAFGTGTAVATIKSYPFYKSKTGANYVASPPAQNVTLAKNRLKNMADAIGAAGLPYYDSSTGKVSVSWAQIQVYLVEQTLMTTEQAYAHITGPTPADWGWTVAGSGSGNQLVPASASSTTLPMAASFSLRAPMKAPALVAPVEEEIHEDIVTEDKTVSEDGLTETTVKTLQTWNEEQECYDTTVETTVVVTVLGDGFTTIVTTVTPAKLIYDEETGEPILVPGEPKTTTETILDEEPAETPPPAESVEPTETPDPTETEKPDDNNVGADVPVGPEESKEPTDPEESPEPAESVEPTESPDVGADVPIGPEETTDPEESPEPAESVEPTDPDDAGGPGVPPLQDVNDSNDNVGPDAPGGPTDGSNDGTGDDNTDAPSSGVGDADATFPQEGEGSEGQEEPDNNNVGAVIPDGPEETTDTEDGSEGQEDGTKDDVEAAALGGLTGTTDSDDGDGTPRAACPTAESERIATALAGPRNDGDTVLTLSSPAPALPQWVQDMGGEVPDWAMEKVLAGEEIPEWAILLIQAGKDIPPWAAELAQNGEELPEEAAILVANGEDLPLEWPAVTEPEGKDESPQVLEPEVDPPKPDDTGGGEDPATDAPSSVAGIAGATFPPAGEGNVGTGIPDGPEATGGLSISTVRTQQSSPAARQRFGPPNGEGRTDQEFPKGSNTSSRRILL